MRVIGLAVVLAVSVLASFAAEAQPQPGKVYKIGVIGNTGPAADVSGPNPRNQNVAALLRGLREFGYEYGRDFVTESRSAEGSPERSIAIAAEFARLNLDVIVAASPTLFAIKRAGIATPVVMVGTTIDPVESGFITSLAHPGGNFTGMILPTLEIDPKRLQLLTELVPGVVRVAVLRGPSRSGLDWKELQNAARLLTREVLNLEVRSAGEIESAFRTAIEWRAGALLVLGSSVIEQAARQVVERASMHRLPAMYPIRNFYMAEGGLISYGVDLRDIYRQPASYVDKILKGAKPSDLPVQQPTKLELVINLKTAKALGLTIPQSILVRADQVIE